VCTVYVGVVLVCLHLSQMHLCKGGPGHLACHQQAKLAHHGVLEMLVHWTFAATLAVTGPAAEFRLL
jgi:hypothetical protein